MEALDSALEHVSPGPGPTIPAVRLEPPEFVAGRLEGAREPLFAVGFGVDELPPEDWLALHTLLSLAQNRMLATQVPGLQVHELVPAGL